MVHAGAAAVGEPGEAGEPDGAGVATRRQEPETLIERSESTRRAASWTDAGNEVEVWVGDEVVAGTDVVPDAEGAVPAPLVLIHPRPVRRVRVGQRPSFIVRTESGAIVSGALLVRAGDEWERHPLTPYSAGFWGTKVYVTADMDRGFDYFFEVEGDAGPVELTDGSGPYRVAVAR